MLERLRLTSRDEPAESTTEKYAVSLCIVRNESLVATGVPVRVAPRGAGAMLDRGGPLPTEKSF